MQQSDYYLYIVPQTGKVYRTKDFNSNLERQLCQKYGRIFAISGYSKAAKIISLVRDDRLYELDTVDSNKELRLDRDFELPIGYIGEVSPEDIAITKEDIEEGIRCSLL